jgi:hypothetical protein
MNWLLLRADMRLLSVVSDRFLGRRLSGGLLAAVIELDPTPANRESWTCLVLCIVVG